MCVRACVCACVCVCACACACVIMVICCPGQLLEWEPVTEAVLSTLPVDMPAC